MKNLYRNEETGRSMVEMLGVLAIIGVLSVGGISGYSKAMTKFKISKSMDQVSMLVANVRTLFSGQKDYTGLKTSTAVDYGIVPSEMANTDKTLTNAFAGNVYINASAAAGAKNFNVIYSGLGQEACVSLATADWGSGSSSGLVGMNVASTAIAADPGNAAITPTFDGSNTTTKALPVPLASAATNCACTTATCTISWVYF